MRNKYKGDDLRGRLENTILRYNKVPYLCGVNGETLELLDIVTGELVHRIEPDDFLLDISSVPLGYMNSSHYKCAIYLKRHPYRKFKQGVVLELLTSSPLIQSPKKFNASPSRLRCAGLVRSITGNFPNLAEAIKLITSGAVSVALSRDVAILRDAAEIKVFIKEDEVGSFSITDKSPVVKLKEHVFPWIYESILANAGLKTVDNKISTKISTKSLGVDW